MRGDDRVDQVAAKGPKASEDSILVRARKPRIADDIGHQDRRELPSLAHGAIAEARSPVADGLGMVRFHAALQMTWKQGAHPCVSTGLSIHEV